MNRHTNFFNVVLRRGLAITAFALVTLLTCCSDFARIDIPEEVISSDIVFKDDSMATSALRGIYSYTIQNGSFTSGDPMSISYLGGLSSDEFIWVNLFMESGLVLVADNQIQPNDTYSLAIWTSCYKVIYYSNSLLEGLESSKNISPITRARLEGEARFLRAFAYFYLVNSFGKVPVVLTTNYKVNAVASRESEDMVYQQIFDDLNAAATLLTNYPAGRRTRVNVWAAHAMLARVYLYRREWTKAEEHAAAVINSGVYSIEPDLNNIFLTGSREAIWYLKPPFTNIGMGTFEATFQWGTPMVNNDVATWFEENDLRSDWVAPTVTETGDIGYYPNKYKVTYIPPDGSVKEEYSMVLRLAEQYLIRAEARTELLNIDGAVEDVDVIRQRAGLPLLADVGPPVDQETMREAIWQERRIEFFGEWGHRWLDLKRTNRANAVLSLVKPATWQPTDVLYPVPISEILNDQNLLPQNDGY